MKRSLWVIEIQMDDGTWEPTVGAGLTRADGRDKLWQWRYGSSIKFRLVRYVPYEKKRLDICMREDQ